MGVQVALQPSLNSIEKAVSDKEQEKKLKEQSKCEKDKVLMEVKETHQSRLLHQKEKEKLQKHNHVILQDLVQAVENKKQEKEDCKLYMLKNIQVLQAVPRAAHEMESVIQ